MRIHINSSPVVVNRFAKAQVAEQRADAFQAQAEELLKQAKRLQERAEQEEKKAWLLRRQG